MASQSDSALVLFPGALGDFLCFLPALTALRAKHVGRLCLVAQPALFDLVRLGPAAGVFSMARFPLRGASGQDWSLQTAKSDRLLADTATVSIHRREIADLFSTSASIAAETAALFGSFGHVYSWTGFGDAHFTRRIAQASGGRVEVHRFRGMRPGEHAADYYARCVGLKPALPNGSVLEDDSQWFTGFAAQHELTERGFVLMHPGSGAREKNWEGFGAVAHRWRAKHGDEIVTLLGPVEMERPTPPVPGAIVVAGTSLRQVAALLRRCRLYVGNDSGISHLAGVIGACGVVLFASTDPIVWGPRGACLKILHAPTACAHCGSGRFCTHRLAVKPVIAALEDAAVSVKA